MEKNFRVLFGTAYFLLVAVVIGLLSVSAFARTEIAAQTETAQTDVREDIKSNDFQSPVADFIEVTVGMTADEVKDKLGKAKVEDKDGLYYKFSNDKSAQIVLDENKKVRVISMMYDGESAGAPRPADIFGNDVKIEPDADGKIYKLINYPDAGYWVAYSKAAEDEAMIFVTIQKM